MGILSGTEYGFQTEGAGSIPVARSTEVLRPEE